jgi:hypothetical protein
MKVWWILFSCLLLLCHPSLAQENETASPSSLMAPTPSPSTAALEIGAPTAMPVDVNVNGNNDTSVATDMPVNDNTSTATASPTLRFSIPPTAAPLAVSPTEVPTSISAPTVPTMILVPVVAFVPLEIRNTNSLLIGNTAKQYLSTTRAFLILKLPKIEFTDVIISRQSRQRLSRTLQAQEQRPRSLQALPLFVDLGVTGYRVLLNDESSPSEGLDFETELVDIFTTFEDEYVQALRSTGDPYFSAVNLAGIASKEDDVEPTGAPITAANDPDEEDPLFSLGAIIGVAVGGFVVLILLTLVYCRLFETKDASDTQTFSSEPTPVTGDVNSSQKKKWLRNSRAAQRETASTKERPLHSLQEQNSDLESQGMYSYAQCDSFMGGMQNNSIAGGDMSTMSYAYSLEPGIESSVIDGGYEPRGQRGVRSVPMEIPQISVKANKQASDPSLTSSNPDYDGQEASMMTGFDDTQISLAPSDLRLTESELAMLPSNLKSDSDDGAGTLITREVMAPAGKLGIVIDTTVDGPVVHHVNEGSALKGKLWPNDIIIAIDKVDTRAMSASAITSLMVKTAKQNRRLTVVGDLQHSN